jgi:phenylpropionate dioxygenase-like ring-hydroxylating dioxygenase large terminal subunit
VPEIAKTKSWPVLEANGTIYMYYDADGHLEDRSWTPPVLPAIADGSYIYHGGIDHYVEAHIQVTLPRNLHFNQN